MATNPALDLSVRCFLHCAPSTQERGCVITREIACGVSHKEGYPWNQHQKQTTFPLFPPPLHTTVSLVHIIYAAVPHMACHLIANCNM